ncbi:MAG: anhydro-N-acetylmuramic acid kinase [Candidatus Bruticola sp.]
MDLIAKYRSLAVPRVVGLMSGTSIDGVDAVLTEIHGGLPKFVRISSLSLPVEIRNRLLNICQNRADVVEVSRMHWLMGEILAQAVLHLQEECRQAGENDHIDLVASHGQTICHLPTAADYLSHRVRATLQIGEGAVIAERTGILTVCDFRPQDLAVGGQGAPLVPFADWLLFKSEDVDRIALNIGGISNITYIPSMGECTACDCGPGNALCDRLAEIYRQQPCDWGGELALSGKIIPKLLRKLMAHPYLSLPAPKSTGREEFGAPLADSLAAEASREGWKEADLMCTAAAFTAQSIALHIKRVTGGKFCQILTGGGGVHNRAIMGELGHLLEGAAAFVSMEECGVPTQAREAMAFALFGHRTVWGLEANLPEATGAAKTCCLGKIVLP